MMSIRQEPLSLKSLISAVPAISYTHGFSSPDILFTMAKAPCL
jgi:hypothetical protein